jgi:DNA-binding Lrp family transcriptional regulator
MVTLVIPDENLSAFSNAFLDEKNRDILFLLLDGPMLENRMIEILKLGKEEFSKRIEVLQDLRLVKRTSLGENQPEAYSLEFSMEKFGGYPKPKITRVLSEAMSEMVTQFLEKYGEEIGSLCDSRGIALSRSVEQLLLSSFSMMMEGLRSEVQEEDKRICEKFSQNKLSEGS